MSVPERPSRGRRRHPRRPVLRRAVLAAVTFTGLLGLLSAGAVAYVYTKYDGQIHRVSALQTKDPNIVDSARQARAENFLIIGSDSRQGENSGFGHVAGQRSDTTIVIHLSADHKRATVVSIPRDSWVQIPACTRADGSRSPAHSDLFNSAFGIGGARCTIATVQKLTGIAVTHFVQIDFAGFKKVVDALGAVTICSPEPVYDANSHLHLKKGANHLNGKDALRYVRARESLGDGSDLSRIKRQQQFLGVVLRQAMSGSLLRNPVQLTHFLDAATKSITVDRATTFGDLRTLAGSLHGLDPHRVEFYTAPIADRNYSPPGDTGGGKVLLDARKGAALYRSIIDDSRPSTSSTSSAPGPDDRSVAAPEPTGGRSVAVPEPDSNAGQKTCV